MATTSPTLNSKLWTEFDGKGFSAKHAEYAERASTDVMGHDLTLTMTNNQVTAIGGKPISAVPPAEMTGATASTDGESGLVPAPEAGDEEKLLTGDGNWTAFENDVFGTQLLDENDQPILDETQTPPTIMYDAGASTDLWTGFAGKGFGAIRAYADQDGHNIKATYVKKAELNEPDEATESDIDNMFIIPNTVVIGDRRYRTVTIGNQEWLAENLDYKFECNGATIPVGGSMESTEPRAWYYNNDEATYGIDGTYQCGLLYNWYATKYLDDHKSTLLADGWRVPYYADWDALCRAIGYPTDADSRTAGGNYLKACDGSVTNNWPDGWNGTDDHGLSIIPAGYCDGTDSSPFWRFGIEVNYWTPDCDWDEETIDRYGSYMYFKQTEIAGLGASGTFNTGFSIRLVRDIS